MKDIYYTYMVGIAVLGWVISCSRECPECPTCSAPSVSAAPSASAEPKPEVKWVHFNNLPETSECGDWPDGMQLEILNKEGIAPEVWKIPYPYRLLVKSGADATSYDIDCGFFPKQQGNGWRTAYCLEAGERKPYQLYIMKVNAPRAMSRVVIEPHIDLQFNRRSCPSGT